MKTKVSKYMEERKKEKNSITIRTYYVTFDFMKNGENMKEKVGPFIYYST
jgi:hypothetical protein